MVFFASFVRIRLTSLAMNCSTGAFPSTTQHPILAQNFLDILIIIYFQQKAYFIPSNISVFHGDCCEFTSDSTLGVKP